MSVEHFSREPAEVRRSRIVDLVGVHGFVRPSDIADSFGVSEETGRRDLAALAGSGRLKRVHGGAVLPEQSPVTEPDRTARSGSSVTRKQQIASVAVALIGVDDTVIFDVGTTVEAAAAALPTDFRGTIVTNNLLVAIGVGKRLEPRVHVIGGRLRPGELTTFGSDALEQLASFHAQVAFIGCGAVHPIHGVSDYTPEDIPLKRTMIENSERTFVLATSEKLGRTATRTVCPVSEPTGVITDSEASSEQITQLRAAGAGVFGPATGRG